ncbi:MAG: hypothetical protein IJV27_09200 [Prevotella sp.]|nr:hypothetical protein [Prevotella sp.]
MKRLVLILIYAIFPLFASGQELERFSPSWTFEVPGTTKAELKERARAFRMHAWLKMEMPERYMWDTKHESNWILTLDHKLESGKLNSIINTFFVILPDEGEYTVNIEKLEITAYNGNFRISDRFIVSEDDEEYYSDKRILSIVQDAKVFATRQVEELLSLIREKMETQDIQFELVQVN